ncbi:MAG TPA: malectin domain-containing carbohydrate-binding protein [Cytophagaceae bacterium]
MIVNITKRTIISITVLSVLLIAGINYSIGQSIDPEVYESILYRVNAGGLTVEGPDPGQIPWEDDDFTSPSNYSNYTTTLNKVYQSNDPISLHSSVPEGTPEYIFHQERSIGTWDINTMEWDFAVEAGRKVEVRLYFAELYFTDPNIRVFDVYIDGQLMLDDYDILADVGHDVGVMKTFTITTEDDNLDIDFKRVKNQPKINAIEILLLKEELEVLSAIAQSRPEISVHPNPFNNYITLKGLPTGNISNEVFLYNSMGELIKKIALNNFDSEAIINFSDVHKGVYYLSFDTFKPIKIIKQ